MLKKADILIEQMEGRGYRATPARRTVLEVISPRRGHFTAEEVCEQAKNVGRATVYRTMKLLVETGIVCRVILEDGSLHYRLSHKDHHHHLVCMACGAVRDFIDSTLEEMVKNLVTKTGFESEGHWLEVYGRCQECRA